MVLVFFHCEAIDHYIIKVDHDKLVKVFVEDLVYRHTKIYRGIGKPKRHYKEFECSISCDKSRPGLISLYNSYLIISRPQV